MIELIVGSDSSVRNTERQKVLKKNQGAIILDDAVTCDSLRSYAYPSLFDDAIPVVIVSFGLESLELTKGVVMELSASPTQFYFFEQSISADMKKLLTKYASISLLDTKAPKKISSTLFYDASALVTESNKLKRWQKLQTLLQNDVPEAFIGIMYWKLRDLATKVGPQKEQYKNMYDALITAHAAAWTSGTPLANAIEKVLLTV